MPRSRSWSDADLTKAVSSSIMIKDVIACLGLTVCAGNYPRIHSAIKRLHLDISHMTGSSNKGGIWGGARPLQDIMVKNSTYTSAFHLKNRLLKAGVFENKCSECGQIPEWRDKPLIMILDHINGDRYDNRCNNLRLLCPNCNTQQHTFCRRKSSL